MSLLRKAALPASLFALLLGTALPEGARAQATTPGEADPYSMVRAVMSSSRDQAGKWRFDLFDEAEAVILSSQLYSRRQDAITGIESVRLNGKEAGRYTVLADPPRFIIKAANGEEIAASAAFDSADAAESAVASTRSLLVSERAANPW